MRCNNMDDDFGSTCNRDNEENASADREVAKKLADITDFFIQSQKMSGFFLTECILVFPQLIWIGTIKRLITTFPPRLNF